MDILLVTKQQPPTVLIADTWTVCQTNDTLEIFVSSNISGRKLMLREDADIVLAILKLYDLQDSTITDSQVVTIADGAKPEEITAAISAAVEAQKLGEKLP